MISIELVVARARNGVIGAGGDMPWHIPDDLKHFKEITTGYPIVMGRKTWDSLPRKPLPNRKNIVMTRNPFDAADDVVCVASVEAAIAVAEKAGAEKLMVIGGGEIYKLFEPRTSRIHLTEIGGEIEGDTYFHLTDPDMWQETTRTPHPLSEPNTHAFAFITLERL